MEPLDSVRRDVEVGQQSRQPATVDVGHVRLLGPGLDDVRGLLLGADEQHLAATAGQLTRENTGRFQHLDGLLEVDDVDPVELAGDVAAHVRVPTTGLVAEMNSGLQEILDSYLRHCFSLMKVLG